MKNGRPAIKGIFSICRCNVFRITKMKNKNLSCKLGNNYICPDCHA